VKAVTISKVWFAEKLPMIAAIESADKAAEEFTGPERNVVPTDVVAEDRGMASIGNGNGNGWGSCARLKSWLSAGFGPEHSWIGRGETRIPQNNR
jgi:hypothetical protein